MYDIDNRHSTHFTHATRISSKFRYQKLKEKQLLLHKQIYRNLKTGGEEFKELIEITELKKLTELIELTEFKELMEIIEITKFKDLIEITEFKN